MDNWRGGRQYPPQANKSMSYPFRGKAIARSKQGHCSEEQLMLESSALQYPYGSNQISEPRVD